MKVWNMIRLTIVLAFLAALQGTVLAQMNGHNLRGDMGLISGSQPPPGIYSASLYVDYNIDTGRDRHGNRIPSAGGDITINGVASAFVWITDKKIFGCKLRFPNCSFLG